MSKRVHCKVHCWKTSRSVELSCLTEVISAQQAPSILGGNLGDCAANRFSVWACRPIEVFEFDASGKDPFEKLNAVIGKYRLKDDNNDLPKGMFACGWIGHFSYELGRFIETLPQTAIDDISLPLIRICFYDRAICYDHTDNTFWLIALEFSNDTVPVDEKLADLESVLDTADHANAYDPIECDLHDLDVSKLRCNMTREQYYERLKAIHRHIYDGDVYQINFSQRFECDYSQRPVDLFHWQNKYNASPYAAFINSNEFAIVSASPEMFITVLDGHISTKPIKGTRPRLTGVLNADKINKVNFTELVESAKEQAELNMIVDLERNDIARICKPGTRKVVTPRTIEEYATVYHAVATVAGELANPNSDTLFCDIMKATFPGGSITGAPKIRAMEIIDNVEPTQRGVYTGSIGFIGVDGTICLNIAIRTVIIKDGVAYAQTGGGIVADSQPDSEWEETITKARALIAGIKAVQGVRN